MRLSSDLSTHYFSCCLLILTLRSGPIHMFLFKIMLLAIYSCFLRQKIFSSCFFLLKPSYSSIHIASYMLKNDTKYSTQIALDKVLLPRSSFPISSNLIDGLTSLKLCIEPRSYQDFSRLQRTLCPFRVFNHLCVWIHRRKCHIISVD